MKKIHQSSGIGIAPHHSPIIAPTYAPKIGVRKAKLVHVDKWEADEEWDVSRSEDGVKNMSCEWGTEGNAQDVYYCCAESAR